MAEFLNQVQDEVIDGFNNMGKLIPQFRKQAAYEHAEQMGLDTPDKRWGLVNGMTEQLERDKPYEAMACGMKYLDLVGTYRVMAVLLAAPESN